jgi:hypothetical protein
MEVVLVEVQDPHCQVVVLFLLARLKVVMGVLVAMAGLEKRGSFLIVYGGDLHRCRSVKVKEIWGVESKQLRVRVKNICSGGAALCQGVKMNTATFGLVILVRVNENMYSSISVVLRLRSVEKHKYRYILHFLCQHHINS